MSDFISQLASFRRFSVEETERLLAEIRDSIDMYDIKRLSISSNDVEWKHEVGRRKFSHVFLALDLNNDLPLSISTSFNSAIAM